MSNDKASPSNKPMFTHANLSLAVYPVLIVVLNFDAVPAILSGTKRHISYFS